MKTSLDWLNAYLDRPVSAEEAEAVLARQGFPVEGRVEQGRDVVLDVEVTSNRGDCLSHVGVAREVAAGTERQVTLPESSLDGLATGGSVEEQTRVENKAAHWCPVYTARVIQGVKIGPSPAWLRQRVEAIGLRSVNNVVDVTNFVLHETGQPLHAFDLAKLAGRRIVVRAAGDGEPFTAIDGTKHALRSTMLVIADADRPVAIAGVMGGLDSEVTAATTDILLESAMFDPLSVRRTSRTLKLASDSSYRFERGVDPRGVEFASRRAARLMAELAGGTLCRGVIRVGVAEPEPLVVTMRVDRCRKLLGVGIAPPRLVKLLERLGLNPLYDEDDAVITCRVPTHRLDLQREVDLIEEVARLHGLDQIPVRHRIEIIARSPQVPILARQKLGQVLTAHSYFETVTPSFLAPQLGQPFLTPGDEALMTVDDRRTADPMLRSSLLPSLLICRKTNQDVGNADIALFEAAAVWSKRQGQILDHRTLALLLDAPRPGDALRSLRGTLEELFDVVSERARFAFKPGPGHWCDDGLELWKGDVRVGAVGVVSKAVTALFDLQTTVVAAELELAPLLEDFPPTRKVAPLPRFPGIERDLSVIVDESVAWEGIERNVRAANPALMEQLRFITAYRGKPIPAGRKSVSFRMTFRDPNKTLRHEEVDAQVTGVVERLKHEVGAELRV